MRRTYQKGEVFGDLTVIDQAPSKGGKARVILKCKCGKIVVQYLGNLHVSSVFVKSCGCSRKKRSEDKTHSKKIFSDTLQDFYLGR